MGLNSQKGMFSAVPVLGQLKFVPSLAFQDGRLEFLVGAVSPSASKRESLIICNDSNQPLSSVQFHTWQVLLVSSSAQPFSSTIHNETHYVVYILSLCG